MAREPEIVRVPLGKFELVRIVTPWEFVVPVRAMVVVGGTQAEAESEWRMAVMEAPVPESSPESDGSLAAAADVEENCQLPATEAVSVT